VTADRGRGTPQTSITEGEKDDQELVTHKGEYRKPSSEPQGRSDGHLGALEDENVPVLPPTTEDGGVADEAGVEPRDELTPG
jgi:hypothetical protein